MSRTAPTYARDMLLSLENSVRTIRTAEAGMLTEHGLSAGIAAAQRLRKCAAAMETELRRQRRDLIAARAEAARETASAERRNAAILQQREGVACPA